MLKAKENNTVEMDSEAMDLIAVQSLKWHKKAAEEFLSEFEEKDKGHPDDFIFYTSFITHIEEVLKYYGH
jgi:hypothetical protein